MRITWVHLRLSVKKKRKRSVKNVIGSYNIDFTLKAQKH